MHVCECIQVLRYIDINLKEHHNYYILIKK